MLATLNGRTLAHACQRRIQMDNTTLLIIIIIVLLVLGAGWYGRGRWF
jgi:uncharacterized protein HemY